MRHHFCVRALDPVARVRHVVFDAAFAEPAARTVKVSAQSQVQVAPDEAVISLEVATSDNNLMTAKADNDKRTQSILALGKKYRLPDNAVRIDTFTVRRQLDREQKAFVAYNVSREIEFALRDLPRSIP